MKRRCPVCDVVLVRKRYESGRLEDRSTFARRKYCSPGCSRRALGRDKLDPRTVWEMRKTMTLRAIADRFGVTDAAVWYCLERWRKKTARRDVPRPEGRKIPRKPHEPSHDASGIGGAEVRRLLRAMGSQRV